MNLITFNFVMLPRKYRLPARIRPEHPTIIHSPYFLAKISRNDLPYSRFGFVVTKSLDKRSTVRNRVKRVFRSCIEELREQICEGYDILFLLRKNIIDKSRESVYHEIQVLLTKKQILK